MHLLTEPWPWYVSGPIIGLFVPALLIVGNRMFGVSSSLRHICAATAPRGVDFFRYEWRRIGAWNIMFLVGIFIGGVVAAQFFAGAGQVALSDAARETIAGFGVTEVTGLIPAQLLSWQTLTTWRGAVMLVGGGLLVGFGASWAGGCTSGHAISGLADRQLPSLIATLGFFAGGLTSAWIIVPMLLGR
ncbi:MAG: YeeE/YedE thiosulfate transporter family protein [Gemmatimonadetes bacterium]|nr:YeeE/YedE thiosulfate transporter family protein [Gemmatimonadota bacterium]